MKRIYQIMFLLIFGTLSTQVQAQEPDVIMVPWLETQGGTVILNSLRSTIASDTVTHANGVIYKLERGGFYWINDPIQHTANIQIIGETLEDNPGSAVCGDGGDEDCGPAIIQRVNRADGTAPSGTMFESNGDLTLKNVWIMGQTEAGNLSTYEPMKLLKTGGTYIFDNVIFDRNDWHHLGPDAGNMDFYVTNCVFRNIFGPTQRWEGLGVRFEVGADTVVFENNTFFNIGFTPFQSEAQPMNYFLVNHNTFVNIGRSFSAGNIWIEALITNNLFVNFNWGGAPFDQYQNNTIDDYDGFFSIGQLNAIYGTDFGRQILVANNSYYLDPAIAAWHASFTPEIIRTQPFINDTTQGWFDKWPNMIYQNNSDANPGLVTNPGDIAGFIDSMTTAMAQLYNNELPSGRYYYDPDRPSVTEDPFAISWPLPEDFSYSNATLQTAATDGLPLGDLNWFPSSKETYNANRDSYVDDIENSVNAPILEIISTVEAEDATLGNNATVEVVEGFKYFSMDGGGSIDYPFNLANAGPVELFLETELRGNSDRGQHVSLDGEPELKNSSTYGEYFWSTSLGDPSSGWFLSHLTPTVQGNLDLTAGDHNLVITPSWGYQSFAALKVVQGGDTVANIGAQDADYEGVNPVAEGAPWAPSRFRSVILDAGGSYSWNVEAAVSGNYLLRIFYAADGNQSVDFYMDDVFTNTVALSDTGDTFSAQFAVTSGSKTLKLTSAAGGVKIDYVQFIGFNLGISGLKDINKKPAGFALEQNYPNPFNPVTKIRFSLGKASDVKLTVYNVLGQKVATLVNERLNAKTWEFDFDGSQFSSGMYIYRLETDGFSSQKKMILIK